MLDISLTAAALRAPCPARARRDRGSTGNDLQQS
jgi:hypothetical protein